MGFFLQKFKDNADFTVKQEVEDTDTAFDKLRESDESPELEAPKRIPAKNAVKKPPAKKKSVRSLPPTQMQT